MRKINLLSKIRRARPFTRYKTAVYKYPNLLQRQFNQTQRNQFWVTDVTYIPTKEGMNYMCAVIDLCGKTVVGYKISKGADINLVSETIKASLKNTTAAVKIHSDQGFQYTSEKYHELSKEYGFEISMSRRGCPLDNAAMENFFGILKTECLRWLKLENLKELTEVVDEYIHFYNYERINKEGLTPYEIWSKTL